jgi:hypothetical protein
MRRDATRDLIDAQTYPTSREDVVETHGDHTIELKNGEEQLSDVLGRFGPETYETPQDLWDAIYCGVSHEAIGRRYYSDRDAYALGEDGPDQVSF